MPAVVAGCMPGGFAGFAFVIVMLIGLMLILSSGMLAVACLLRLACRVAAVPTPDIDQAVFVSFAESMIMMGSALASELAAEYLSIQLNWLVVVVTLSTVAVTFVIPACVYVPALKVTFLKGVVIAVLRYSFTLSLLAVLRLLWALGNGAT